MRRFVKSLGILANLRAGLVLGLLGSLTLSQSTDSSNSQYPLPLTESNQPCLSQTFSTPWTVDASELEDVAGGDIVRVRFLRGGGTDDASSRTRYGNDVCGRCRLGPRKSSFLR